jgi:hypothetical protein
MDPVILSEKEICLILCKMLFNRKILHFTDFLDGSLLILLKHGDSWVYYLNATH